MNVIIVLGIKVLVLEIGSDFLEEDAFYCLFAWLVFEEAINWEAI